MAGKELDVINQLVGWGYVILGLLVCAVGFALQFAPVEKWRQPANVRLMREPAWWVRALHLAAVVIISAGIVFYGVATLSHTRWPVTQIAAYVGLAMAALWWVAVTWWSLASRSQRRQ